MKTKFPLIVIAVFTIGVLVGFLGQHIHTGAPSRQAFAGFMPTCTIKGDVRNPLVLSDTELFSTVEFNYKGECFAGIPLADIVQTAEPAAGSYEVLLIGDDGLSALLPGENLAGSHIVLSSENGWEAINLYHPVSSNIKKLAEIVIVGNDTPMNFGLTIASPNANLRTLTPGGLYKEIMPTIPYYEGTSTITHDGEEFSVSILSRRKLFALSEGINVEDGTKMIVMGKQGEYEYINQQGYLELKNNHFNYITMEREGSIENVAGIMVNPPPHSITDLYHDTLHYLKNDENVLILFLDGFGYHQYLYAVSEGFAPFMAALPTADPALSVYQPVTNAGFAAMITGTTPEENGVYSREQMDLHVPSIFGAAKELGKASALIEGNIKILNTEIEPVLNIDSNNNGFTDDEIFESAVKEIGKEYDLLMVHFHSIDDAGHANGDLHPETLKQITVVDGYVKEVVGAWDGRVIILADHGMHSTADAGNHGEFRFEDLIVPYITVEGGQNR